MIIQKILVILFFVTALVFAQTTTIIFDDESAGATFRDASYGSVFGDGEFLNLAGTSKDKLPIDAIHRYSGIHSGLIEWQHATGGAWELYIANSGWSAKDFSKYDTLIFYLNSPEAIPSSELPLIGLESANFNSKSALIELSNFVQLDSDTTTWQRVSIPFTAFQPFGNFSLAQFKSVRFMNNGVTIKRRTLWIDYIVAFSKSSNPKALRPMTDDELLDTLQYTALQYFLKESNSSNGLVKDRNTTYSGASVAAVGFGVAALGIGVERGWISRTTAKTRVLNTVRTFWYGKQGDAPTGTIGYRGWFYHFLDMNSATRGGTNELSSIDTGLLLAGLIYAREYFDGSDSIETEIRNLVDSIYLRVDWQWMLGGQFTLTHGWSPEKGMLPYRWIGYSEAMVLYILGLGAPKNPLPTVSWTTWTMTYQWINYASYSYVHFAALFGHQYSHCWVDFRDIQDSYMRNKNSTYFENSKRATLANRAYCISNPNNFAGYSDSLWGLTACDGPAPNYYAARGAPYGIDDGTIAPTAAVSSIPFTPNESMKAIRGMVNKFGVDLFGKYGFRDAFNVKENWIATDYLGIDQGPIIIMIENFRTGKVWNTFMKNSYVQNGLYRAGFRPIVSVGENKNNLPEKFALEQNYPNPFNPSTMISYQLPMNSYVSLKVYDVLGKEVATLVNEFKEAGNYTVIFSTQAGSASGADASQLSSGIYYYTLSSGSFTETKKMILVK